MLWWQQPLPEDWYNEDLEASRFIRGLAFAALMLLLTIGVTVGVVVWFLVSMAI
jgi:hypothetical protein